MDNLKITMEMERIDLMSTIEAFNKKAELLGIEQIPLVGTVNPFDDIERKEFSHLCEAREYIERMGCEPFQTASKMYFHGDKTIEIHLKDTNKWGFRVQ